MNELINMLASEEGTANLDIRLAFSDSGAIPETPEKDSSRVQKRTITSLIKEIA